GESGKRRLRFCHQSLQEYYAAEYLLPQLPKLLEDQQGNDDLKSDYLNYRKWTEPVALMLTLVEEAQAVRVVELGLEVDWMLGAQLAGKICESIQSKAVDLIIKEPSTEHFRLHLLGLTRSNAILPLIAQALESEDTNICLTAVMILVKLGTKPALDMLVRVLDHRSSDVRKSAAVKLAEVADHSVSQFTISTLISRSLNKSEAPEIRSSCMIALGKTKNQIAKYILQNVISDPLEDAIVRANAANALVETDLQSAFIYLKRALKDKDVSWCASISLAHIGGRTAESILCEALLDNDPNSRMSAASGLASMNCKTACASLTRALQGQLTKALQDELSNAEQPYYLWHLQAFHANVITRLIDALGHLECTDASRNLLALYEHKDLNVQISTVKAIGKIQKKKAIPLLARLLDEMSCITDSEDQESFSRAIVVSPAVAEELGETGCIEALFILKKALSSQNTFVRAGVISGLERLRLKETLPILLNALSDPNEGVRERVAMVFDNLGENFIDEGDCQIIFALSNYLEDKNATVRKHITQSLWRIGGEAVSISQFITALQDTESMSRMSAARRLGQIADKSDEISSALLDALEDENVGVQTCAAEALGKIANPKLILQLYQSQLKHQCEYVSDAISAIQENCRYYNYEIFQAYLKAQKSDRQKSQNSDRSPITQNFYAPVNAVAGNVGGNLITPPPDSVE
ncbi:MAG: HEAT repeat domain-containing protein, partial [Phormidesmis sp. CAN_BIN44]|nr:HEAT repeat domain-containing protein [Phormidesmis sp. CAN_BIN44]